MGERNYTCPMSLPQRLSRARQQARDRHLGFYLSAAVNLPGEAALVAAYPEVAIVRDRARAVVDKHREWLVATLMRGGQSRLMAEEEVRRDFLNGYRLR